MIKKLSLLLFICILSALNINAEIYEGSCGENVSFSLNLETGVLNITGTGDMTDYYITSNIPWYSQMSKIKSVEISEGVTRIGERTFLNCTSLTNVSMPNSLTSIGYCAFAGCSALNSVIIPNNVTSIGKGGFQNCSGLVSLSIGNSVTAIGSLAFQNCPLLKEVIIPNSVKSIGNNTFEGCIGLTSIDIPNSVTYIGSGAFNGCSSITSINIPNSVYYIGSNAFDGTAWDDNLPEGLIYVGKVFYKYNGTMPEHTSITIDAGTSGIAGSAFEGCSGLISVTIPNSIKSIGYYAFRGCSNLTEVYCNAEKNPTTGGEMLNGVPLSNATLYVPEVSLEKYQSTEPWSGFGTIKAIEEVENIISGSCGENVNYSLNLETGVLSITGTGAMTDYSYTGDAPWYEQREYIKSVEIADGVTTIGERTFRNCSAITSISISNSVTSIKSYAFSSCSSLTSVIIPIGVTSIGLGAFDSKLSSIVVAEGNAKFDSRDNCNAVIETATNTLIKICKNTVIPNSITSIGRGAFYRCPDISSIKIPNSVTSLEDYAFYDCPGLTSVDMLSNIESIGTGAFRSTTWYDNHPDGMIYVGKVFYKYKGTMPENTSISIDEGILGIAGSAFDGCTGLTSINIPNSVKSIGNNAFSNCSGLTSVISEIKEPFAFGSSAFNSISSSCTLTVPYGTRDAYIAAGWTTDVFQGGIEEIEIISGSCGENVNYSLNLETGVLSIYGTGAMADYSSENRAPWYEQREYIKSVEIAEGVTTIGNFAFDDCSDLTSVTIPNGVTIIGYVAFRNCHRMTSVDIPNSVTSIGFYAFSWCRGLTSIAIPNSVISIEEDAFYGCDGLTSITLPNGNVSIGGDAFWGCSLTSIIIPNGVTSIEAGAFSGCSGITSIVVESENTKYDSRDNCNAIIETATNTLVAGCKNTIIPDNVTSIGGRAFSGCSGLTSVTIPNNVTYIGESAFYGCSSLTSIDIPNSVTLIDGLAFCGCTGITSITIPNSITSIRDRAFDGCSGLTEVYCYAENVPDTYANAFENVDLSNATLYVPAASIEAYQAAEPWSQFGNIMKIDTDISQMDNVMYVESFEGHSASQVIMPIQMKNSAEIRGFQFNLYLPDGVTIALNPKGKEKVSLSHERRDEYDEHTLSVRKQDDGSYQFLCGSLSEDTFLGNDGGVATVTLDIAEEMDNGNYPIILKNIKLTENDISKYYETPQVRSTLTVVSYVLGDINDDGKIDVSDYIGIANHILGNTPEDFNLRAADVDENGVIDVSDYIGVANIILTGSIYGSQQ